MLIICFISIFINYNFKQYLILGNGVGCSIFSNIPFILFFTLKTKYCMFTRLSPIGLIIINIIDIIGTYIDENFYNFWYTFITCVIIFGLVAILEIKKELNKW